MGIYFGTIPNNRCNTYRLKTNDIYDILRYNESYSKCRKCLFDYHGYIKNIISSEEKIKFMTFEEFLHEKR